MALSGTNSQTDAQPLPLFRPEALAAQEKGHGEVLRIRLIPLAFFPWLALTVAAVALAYLLTGHYTEKLQVTGFLSAEPGRADRAQAFLVVPARWVGAFVPGARIAVRCPGCSDVGRRLAAQVVEVSPLADQNAPTFKILLALPSDISNFLPPPRSPQSSTRLEAEIPLGRRPLIHWLLEQREP
jgi:hypothetical protein